MGAAWHTAISSARPRRRLVCCFDRAGLVERLDLSPLGLLVAASGRLGQVLRRAAADDQPRDAVPARLPAGPGQDRTGGWRDVAAWLYLCATLVPTVAIVPASLVRGTPAWRIAAGCAGPLLILILSLAHSWAAPALDARRRHVTGGVERGMLREAHAAVCAVRAARREPGASVDPVPEAVLDQALWNLAGALTAAEHARTAQGPVRTALHQLAADDPLIRELRLRQVALCRARHAARTEAVHQLAALRALAAARHQPPAK